MTDTSSPTKENDEVLRDIPKPDVRGIRFLPMSFLYIAPTSARHHVGREVYGRPPPSQKRRGSQCKEITIKMIYKQLERCCRERDRSDNMIYCLNNWSYGFWKKWDFERGKGVFCVTCWHVLGIDHPLELLLWPIDLHRYFRPGLDLCPPSHGILLAAVRRRLSC